MREPEEIYECVKRKAIETIKNEIIALSDEEFKAMTSEEMEVPCPSEFGLKDAYEENCYGVHCYECWKKATGRK